jgi:hypothetical protein
MSRKGNLRIDYFGRIKSISVIMKMEFWRISSLFAVTFFIISGCSRPEYPTQFVSSDPDEFDSYLKKYSERPSPPSRSSFDLGPSDLFITYSQPAVKGREIWGSLVKFDAIWRTGANEATVFSVTGDVLVNGDTIKAGNYALYTIPSENEWTIILNKKYEVWGAYDYQQAEDVLRFNVVPTLGNQFTERMTFTINNSGLVQFNWEELMFNFIVLPL